MQWCQQLAPSTKLCTVMKQSWDKIYVHTSIKQIWCLSTILIESLTNWYFHSKSQEDLEKATAPPWRKWQDVNWMDFRNKCQNGQMTQTWSIYSVYTAPCRTIIWMLCKSCTAVAAAAVAADSNLATSTWSHGDTLGITPFLQSFAAPGMASLSDMVLRFVCWSLLLLVSKSSSSNIYKICRNLAACHTSLNKKIPFF